jgi:hypothetical protein
MPRFIDYDYNQTVLLPVAFENQILPGTFEPGLVSGSDQVKFLKS